MSLTAHTFADTSSGAPAAPPATPLTDAGTASAAVAEASVRLQPMDFARTAEIGRAADRRSLSAFPGNAARGFAGVLAPSNVRPLLGATALAFASHGFDRPVASSLEGRCGSCGRTGAKLGGAAVVPVVGAVFVAGRLAPPGRFRDFSYDLTETLVVNAAWTGALKYSLDRRRPDGGDRLSLPSGHASTAFALATVADRHFGWKAGLPAYVLAGSIGLSRIERNRHHLSDVLAGAALGTIVGRTVTRQNAGSEPSRRRVLSIGPSSDANGGGVGIGLTASF